jgi:hypothetical protein
MPHITGIAATTWSRILNGFDRNDQFTGAECLAKS